jgi:hypothetical protein
VVGEATAGLFDDERWCGMVPEVACKPNACGDLALGDATLLAPRQLGRPSSDDLFEPSPGLMAEQLEPWKARDTLRRERQ